MQRSAQYAANVATPVKYRLSLSQIGLFFAKSVGKNGIPGIRKTQCILSRERRKCFKHLPHKGAVRKGG
jgi:hypothetical protein